MSILLFLKKTAACLLLLAATTLPKQSNAQTLVSGLTSLTSLPKSVSQSQSLEAALDQLKKRFGVVFIFNSRLVEGKTTREPVTQTQRLEESLRQMLTPWELAFERLDAKTYVIRPLRRQARVTGTPTPPDTTRPFSLPDQLPPIPLPLNAGASQVQISGRVTDNAGGGVPGVNVLLKGTTIGTTTDPEGKYALTIPDANANGTLVFSYIGYITEETAINGRTVVDVSLVPDIKSLSEVVVIGYGTQQKKEVTGSVASIAAEKIENLPVTGVDQALTGQLAGVQVQQTTGAPGGNINVRIRGSGSIGAGNEPLYVVDGFPGVTNLNAINPNDIESIEVLKDASAAAIYGSRGANGVVIITTKRGKSGQTKFNVDAYTGLQQVINKVELMNATEYARHAIRARNNGFADRGGNPDLTQVKNSNRPLQHQIFPLFLENDSSNNVNPDLGVGTDWQDQIFRVAPVRNFQLTATGGTDKIQYAITGGYFNQQGIIIESGFERFSARINLDAELTRKLKVGFNLAPSYTRRKIVNSDDTWSRQGIILTALAIPPYLPVQNPDGTYAEPFGVGFGINSMNNPVAIARLYDINSQGFVNTGNLFLEFQPLPGLALRSAVGVNIVTAADNDYYPSTLGRGNPPPSQARGQSSSSFGLNWVNSNTITYTRTLVEKHNLTVLAGNETQKQVTDNNEVEATKFPTDVAPFVNAAGEITGGGAGRSEWSLLSYFGRITYNYAGKYLLTTNIRRDGSSRFGTNNKWGVFPSASVGWRVTEESFMQDLPLLSELKFRASYGLGGNNNIGNYAFRGLLSDQNYILGAGLGELVTGLAPNNLINPDLKWETSRQLDIGVDLGMLEDRIYLVADYYDKETDDLLLNVNVPRITGYRSVLTNIGKVRNWGWEFTVNTRNLVGGFKWSTDFNISFNRNRVLALGPEGDPILQGTSQIPQSHITQIGQPLGNFYGYIVEGVFNTQEEINAHPRWTSGNPTRPGDYKFRDVNGDGIINSQDRTVIGNAYPDFIYGLTNTFSYKNFDLNILIQGTQGSEVINGTRRFLATLSNGTNQLALVNDSWKSPEEPGNGIARPFSGIGSSNNNANMNSTWMEDGSYLRIRNITLGYTLPSNVVKRLFLQNLRVYATVQNAFMFTRYTGYNPEVSFGNRSVLNPGVDYGTYPLARTTMIGFTVGF